VTRVVLDASVLLLSATVGRPDSPPSLLVDAVRSGEVEVIACDHVLIEVRNGLAGGYFRDRVSDDERTAFLAMLRTLAAPLADRSTRRVCFVTRLMTTS
jgi:PIN domain